MAVITGNPVDYLRQGSLTPDRSQSYNNYSEDILIIENLNTFVYIGREAITDGTTTPTEAVDAVDNPQAGLVSYGRHHRAWWRVSCCKFRRHLSLMCPQSSLGEIKIENTNTSVYQARSNHRRNCCTHRGSRWRRQPSGVSSILRPLSSRAVSCFLLSGALFGTTVAIVCFRTDAPRPGRAD